MDATGGYAVEPEGGERLEFGGGTVLIKAATPAFTVWEELPPLLDTPLHVHAHEDELFHILDGEHVFKCGGDRFEVGPGDFLALPRRVPHAHRRLVPGAGRFLVMTCPGGFDGFFRMLSDADRAGTLGSETYAEASLRYGITWLSESDPARASSRNAGPADRAPLRSVIDAAPGLPLCKGQARASVV